MAAQRLAGDANMQKVVYNCAPAICADGTKVYIAVNHSSFSSGYLCMAEAENLSPQKSILLAGPASRTGAATLPDDGTASPTIGPDGDVYYGVLEGNFPSNHARGWMLHFDSAADDGQDPRGVRLGRFGVDRAERPGASYRARRRTWF